MNAIVISQANCLSAGVIRVRYRVLLSFAYSTLAFSDETSSCASFLCIDPQQCNTPKRRYSALAGGGNVGNWSTARDRLQGRIGSPNKLRRRTFITDESPQSFEIAIRKEEGTRSHFYAASSRVLESSSPLNVAKSWNDREQSNSFRVISFTFPRKSEGIPPLQRPIYLTAVSFFLIDPEDDEPEERWKSRFAREYSVASRLAEVPELTSRPRHRPPSSPSRPPRGDIRKRPRAISGVQATPRTNGRDRAVLVAAATRRTQRARRDRRRARRRYFWDHASA